MEGGSGWEGQVERFTCVAYAASKGCLHTLSLRREHFRTECSHISE